MNKTTIFVSLFFLIIGIFIGFLYDSEPKEIKVSETEQISYFEQNLVCNAMKEKIDQKASKQGLDFWRNFFGTNLLQSPVRHLFVHRILKPNL